MSVRAIIADDEAPLRDELRYLLARIGGVEVVGEAANGREALEMIAHLRPDVVFLDIRMPGLDGLAVARQALAMEGPPQVVFTTAYDRYAVSAFEAGALDYVLKPFREERLRRTVERVKATATDRGAADGGATDGGATDRGATDGGAAERLAAVARFLAERETRLGKLPALQPDGTWLLLDDRDILWFCAEGKKVYAQTRERRLRVRLTLRELEERLDRRRFFRCHKSYIVNLDEVEQVVPWFGGTYNLVLKGAAQAEVPLSRKYAKDLKERLGW